MENRNMTAVITGGTAGLGKSLVAKLLSQGWNVATFGRRPERVGELRTLGDGEKLLAESIDMRIELQLDNFFRRVAEKFGTVDLIILNAGDVGPARLPEISSLQLIDLRMIFETNLFASFSVLKRAIAHRSDKLLAIHITSDVVQNAYTGWGGYGASKSAMDFIMKTLDAEQRPSGIRAASIDPGDMDTEMHHQVLPEDTGLRNPDDSAEDVFSYIAEYFTGDGQ